MTAAEEVLSADRIEIDVLRGFSLDARVAVAATHPAHTGRKLCLG
jgi:hypothetical protein